MKQSILTYQVKSRKKGNGETSCDKTIHYGLILSQSYREQTVILCCIFFKQVS